MWNTWQGQPFTGTAYGLNPDGTLRSGTECLDGRMHGRYCIWHSTDPLKPEWVYDDTKPCRTAREWDEAGRLRAQVLAEDSFRVAEQQWDEQQWDEQQWDEQGRWAAGSRPAALTTRQSRKSAPSTGVPLGRIERAMMWKRREQT